MSSQDLGASGNDDGGGNFPDGKLTPDAGQQPPPGIDVKNTISQQYVQQNVGLNFEGNTASNEMLKNVCAMLDRRITDRMNAVRAMIMQDQPQSELHELNGRAKDIAEKGIQAERINEIGINQAAREWQLYLAWKHQVMTKNLLQAQLASQGEELNRARVDRENKDREMARMQELLRIEIAETQKLERERERRQEMLTPTSPPLLGSHRCRTPWIERQC